MISETRRKEKAHQPDRGAPTRIVFVDHSGQPGGGQLGLERYLLVTTGLHKTAIFLEDGIVAQRLAAASADVLILGAPTSKWGVLRRTFRLALTLKRLRPQLVVANSMKAAVALALLPKRGSHRVLYLRDDLNRERLSRLRWTFFARLILPRYDSYLANSEWTASTIPRAVSERPTRVAYPVSGAFAGSANHSSRDFGGTIHILSLSRLARWKGVHVLVEALELLAEMGDSDVSATIAGDAIFEDESYVSDLRTRCANLGGRVRMVGHVDDVGPLLESHHILVSCSLTPEPFGQVVVQGMSAGLVTIATNQGGPAEIIDPNVDGILVSPGEPSELAQTIRALLADRDRMAGLAVAASRSVTRFSDATTVAALDDALLQLEREV